MVESPLVFNESEQLSLQQLEKQIQAFSTYAAVVKRTLHSGQDSIIVAQLLNFLNDLGKQTATQIEQVRESAKARLSKPEASKEK